MQRQKAPVHVSPVPPSNVRPTNWLFSPGFRTLTKKPCLRDGHVRFRTGDHPKHNLVDGNV